MRRVTRQRLAEGFEDGPSLQESFDEQCFRQLTVLLPGKDFATRRDSPFVELLQRYRSADSRSDELKATNALGKYIDAHWTVNPTFIDLDSEEANRADMERYANGRTVPVEAMVPFMEWDPTELDERLGAAFIGLPTEMPPQTASNGPLNRICKFFAKLSLSLAKLSGRVMVEAVVGEMADFMEHNRWDCLDHRKDPIGGIDPSKFPRAYDRIHMSNILDYVGGLLTVAMYARPLLREDRDSNLQFNVLLNPPQVGSGTDSRFAAEYMLMCNRNHISNHFSLFTKEKDHSTFSPFGIGNYAIWEKVPHAILDRKDMLSRPQLEEWLYAHFLKICLPYPRDIRAMAPVLSPLNLTAFLRLISHLSDLGYPSHWPSGILSALCSGTITTSARPPRSLVTNKADIEAVYPARKMSVAPWLVNFTTLLSIWAPLLPFGLGGLQPKTITPPTDMALYSVTFPPFVAIEILRPHFELVFWDYSNARILKTTSSMEQMAQKGGSGGFLRSLLADDETGDVSSHGREFRNGDGVQMFSTFRYVTATRTASFWCSKEWARSMKESGGWKVFIWRTDNWERVTQGVDVKGSVEFVRSWDE